MKPLFSAKSLAVAALVFGAVAAASAVHAHSDMFLSTVVQPGYYANPTPVYVQPRPAYVAPAPVYEQYGYETDRDWRHDVYRWQHRGRYGDRYARRFGPWGDLDHDGVPNRYDRYPDNPYRR
ncbi:MAG: hypothetical protein ABIU58_11090 [Ramlibacter sp.]